MSNLHYSLEVVADRDVAGIFIPSLAVGACFGRIVGLAMEYVEYSHPHWGIWGICADEDCVVPGLYAMVSQHQLLATRIELSASRLAPLPPWPESHEPPSPSSSLSSNSPTRSTMSFPLCWVYW